MDVARLNDGSSAHFDRYPYATGSFKVCYLGRYDNGSRRGEKCLAKEFKEGSVYAAGYFDQELSVVADTELILQKFNSERIIGSRKITINLPTIATCHDSRARGMKAMVEPFIDKFKKFNSNSGWACTDEEEWGEAMQALSHYSYHISGGLVLLCDLQGGIYRDGA
jgi:Alpha-kinase family